VTRIRGQVEAMQGSTLFGWAFDEDEPQRICQIRVADQTGRVVAGGPASRSRPAVAGLNIGRTDIAFRIGLPATTDRQMLFVFADGALVGKAMLEVGPGLFDGEAGVRDGTVSGWVTERVLGFKPPLVRVTDQDGRLLAEAVAEQDDGDEESDHRPAKFSFALPDQAFEGKCLLLSVSANGTGFARCEAPLRLAGYLDQLTAERCDGWLYSPDAPGRPFDIVVRQDGRTIGRGRTHEPRDDIKGQYPDAQAPGFGFALRSATAPSASRISITLAQGEHELFGGPFEVATLPGVAALTQRVVLLAQALPQEAAAAALLRTALRTTLQAARGAGGLTLLHGPVAARQTGTRMCVVVPVYRDVQGTLACLQSVLDARDARTDRIVIVEDASPDSGMAEALRAVALQPNVILLHNSRNLGFVGSVNRGIGLCLTGDVLLLNSDTQLFPGALDELHAVLHAAPDIGTATALSNNATAFSYPHPDLRKAALDDSTWAALAAVALDRNRGMAVDVPTAHGFCMLIRAELLLRVPGMNEAFGRGYGEENDFCRRAADLGYRHVAACGVLVEHRESVSFGGDRDSLRQANLQMLDRLYPEYHGLIRAFEERDPLRVARRALDLHRMQRVGGNALVVLESWLDGGSRKAAAELTDLLLEPGQLLLSVRCLESGQVIVEARAPAMRAVFAADEAEALFALLDAAQPTAVIVHQLVGYRQAMLRALADWLGGRRGIAYLHDFYAICPRVTLIDAVEEFCGVPDTETCARCVALGGAHESSRLEELSPTAHRALFAGLLGRAAAVVTPSRDTAAWLARALPEISTISIPHPERAAAVVLPPGRRGHIALLGAIGRHKGSRLLVEIARRARIARPDLQFHVIGYTDRDDELCEIGNVTLTGRYEAEALPGLVRAANAASALFLHGWPETFSYTLSEAARFGLVPVVPDIGAPAQRVRAAGWGLVFPFPTDPRAVVSLLGQFADGAVDGGGGDPAALLPSAATVEPLRALLRRGKARPDAAASRPRVVRARARPIA
jgi:GT2 family glycosyltransferase